MPRVVREREMLEVAGRVFAQRGFHAASMEEIAEGAGVSKPMIYNYFGSKEGLYFAYIELAGQRMLARMRNAVQAAGERPEERLWASALASRWPTGGLAPFSTTLDASGRKPGKVRFRCPELGRRIPRSSAARRSDWRSSAISRSGSWRSRWGSLT